VRDGDELRTARQTRVQRVEVERAVVAYLDVVERRPYLLAEELPRHDVRVVLHLRDEHPVALSDIATTPRVRDEVDRLGHVLGEQRLLVGGADPRGDRASRVLEGVGRLLRERVDAAMDVRVRVPQELRHPVDHDRRLLRRRPAVQVDERLAAVHPGQDRELARDRGRVELRAGADGGGRHRYAAAASASTSPMIGP
jgi:hypothetical protein